MSSSVVEPYNSILTTHTTLEHSDCSFMVRDAVSFFVYFSTHSSHRSITKLFMTFARRTSGFPPQDSPTLIESLLKWYQVLPRPCDLMAVLTWILTNSKPILCRKSLKVYLALAPIYLSLLWFASFPRIHFPLATYAPIISADKAFHEQNSVAEMTFSCFESGNQMVCAIRLLRGFVDHI